MQQVKRETFLAGARIVDPRALPVPVRSSHRKLANNFGRLWVLHSTLIKRGLAIAMLLAGVTAVVTIADDLDAVVPVPASKLYFTFDRPWWEDIGLSSGRSVTDLPIRQCLYFGVEDEADGGETHNRTALFVASYNDDEASIWRIDEADWTGGARDGVLAEHVGRLPIPEGARPTGASMSAGGDRLVLASYDNGGYNHPLVEYAIDRSQTNWTGAFEGQSLGDLLAADLAREIAYPGEYRKMNEAVTYLHDDSSSLAVWAENDLPLYTLDALSIPIPATPGPWSGDLSALFPPPEHP